MAAVMYHARCLRKYFAGNIGNWFGSSQHPENHGTGSQHTLFPTSSKLCGVCEGFSFFRSDPLPAARFCSQTVVKAWFFTGWQIMHLPDCPTPIGPQAPSPSLEPTMNGKLPSHSKFFDVLCTPSSHESV